MELSESDNLKLKAAAKRQRERLGVRDDPPKAIVQPADDKRVLNQNRANRLTPEQRTELARRREAEAEIRRKRETGQRVQLLASSLGARYARCTLESFICDTNPKRQVVERLREVYGGLGEPNWKVPNLVLFGPVGTGKDHLMAALMLQSARLGKTVCWVNGMDLYAIYRDSINGEITEQQLASRYSEPDVLAISDPTPPWGKLSEGQVRFLYRILDRRYRDLKPVWCSMNVANSAETAARMSDQLENRLKHNAVCLHCDWESFRKPRV